MLDCIIGIISPVMLFSPSLPLPLSPSPPLSLPPPPLKSDADVFGCQKDGSTIHVVDTWNPSRRYSENILDNNQDGMCHHYSEHKNGRMKCV